MKKELFIKSFLILVLTGILVMLFCAAVNLRAEQMLRPGAKNRPPCGSSLSLFFWEAREA